VECFIEPQAGADEDGDESPDVVVACAEELLDLSRWLEPGERSLRYLQILDQPKRVLGAPALLDEVAIGGDSEANSVLIVAFEIGSSLDLSTLRSSKRGARSGLAHASRFGGSGTNRDTRRWYAWYASPFDRIACISVSSILEWRPRPTPRVRAPPQAEIWFDDACLGRPNGA
jgi:hypothetical protein